MKWNVTRFRQISQILFHQNIHWKLCALCMSVIMIKFILNVVRYSSKLANNNNTITCSAELIAYCPYHILCIVWNICETVKICDFVCNVPFIDTLFTVHCSLYIIHNACPLLRHLLAFGVHILQCLKSTWVQFDSNAIKCKI